MPGCNKTIIPLALVRHKIVMAKDRGEAKLASLPFGIFNLRLWNLLFTQSAFNMNFWGRLNKEYRKEG